MYSPYTDGQEQTPADIEERALSLLRQSWRKRGFNRTQSDDLAQQEWRLRTDMMRDGFKGWETLNYTVRTVCGAPCILIAEVAQ